MTKKLTRRRGALSFFIPDLYVHDIAAIDTEMLVDSGIRFVISDIDNTLAPYESPTPHEAALDFYARLEAAGIKLAFVSNNKAARVDLYNGQTHYPAISKAGKPKKTALISLMEQVGASSDETMMLGDQIFTDVCAGRGAGVRCILVDPIKDRKDIGTRLKRVGEIPLKHLYKRKENKT